MGRLAIPAESVTGATLYRTRQLLMRATVLEIQTADRTYQLGFNPG